MMLTEDQVRLRLQQALLVYVEGDGDLHSPSGLFDVLAELLPDLVATASGRSGVYAETDRLYQQIVTSDAWQQRMGLAEPAVGGD